MSPMDKDAQISRFWEKFIEKSKRYDIKQNAIRWHVKHAEQYIKAHKTQLKAHTALDLDEYFQAKGRNTGLKKWHNVRLLILTYSYSLMPSFAKFVRSKVVLCAYLDLFGFINGSTKKFNANANANANYLTYLVANRMLASSNGVAVMLNITNCSIYPLIPLQGKQLNQLPQA